MKKLFILFIGLAFVTFGCKKDQPQTQSDQLVDVSFSGQTMSKNIGGAKATDSCFTEKADWAVISIDGTTYTTDVYYIDGQPFTKAIKLAPGTYHITDFELKTDNNTPDPTDDTIIAATPADGSDYAGFVTDGVPITFDVTGFTKIQIPVEVLCFQDYQYNEFGFFWYTYDQIVVRTQCFFGDFCVKNPDDYTGSLYAQQAGGLKLDMPAIFQIEVKRNGQPLKVVNNEAWLGVGQPLCVSYPDELDSTDNYEFILSVLVRVGDNFEYKPFHTWTFSDDGMINAGDDGVVDFVLGNCVQSDADFTFAPYMNLPETVDMTIQYPGDPGYWDLAINSVSPNATYDLHTGNYAGFCGDHDNVIGSGNHNANVYSSLVSDNWPAGMPFDLATISKVNWLFNHLSYYSMDPNSLTQAQGLIIQDAIWKLINNISTSGVAAQMATDASTHGDFSPLPGGYAAVLFVTNDNPGYQLIFTIVDP
jgi:hypothetical protein